MALDDNIENAAWRQSLRDFKAYLALERHLSQNPVEAYLRDVAHLARYAQQQGRGPDAVDLELLRGLLVQLTDAGVAIASQCRIVSGWRTFYKMMVVSDAMDENPAELLDMPRGSRHLPDVFSDSEVKDTYEKYIVQDMLVDREGNIAAHTILDYLAEDEK